MKNLLAFFLLLSCETGLIAQTLTTSRIIESTDKISTKIKSIELSAPQDDIKLLWKSIGKSSIIGLGEGTHGTSDFFKLKNRIIKYGIEEKGLKLILVEESFSNVFKLNDYVRNGNGTAHDALNKFSAWIYQTQEVVELVEFVRNFNKDKLETNKVTFLGFDVQSIAGAIKELKENKVYEKSNIENTLTKLDSLAKNYVLHDFWTKDVQVDVKSIIAYLKDKKIENQEEEIKKQLMILQLEKGLQLWTNKNKWEDFGEKRDSLMANSIPEIMKITNNLNSFVWGHNGHIMKYKAGNYKTMGLILSENFKTNYYAIGFDFNKGCFKAYDMNEKKHTNFCVEEAENGTTASVFKFSKNKIFFLGLRKAMKNKPLAEFLKTTPYYRQVQAVYDSSKKDNAYTGFTEDKIKLWEFYDAWIYVNETKASEFYR